MPKSVVIVLTHLPNERGYHEGRFEIVQTCLNSIRKNTPGVPVMVWDNGSCAKLRNWLTELYKPEYTVFSPNLGKRSARCAAMRMLPPETLVGYADDDMLFWPGWWDASLKLLEGFPNVAMVSAWPVRPVFGWGNTSTIEAMKKKGTVEYGRWITEREERDYAISVGLPEQDYILRTRTMQDIRVTYQGKQAYAEAHHCQFLCKAGKLQPFTIYTRDALGGEKDFDEAIDRAGLLRLTTTQRYTFHMGNVLDERTRALVKEAGL